MPYTLAIVKHKKKKKSMLLDSPNVQPFTKYNSHCYLTAYEVQYLKNLTKILQNTKKGQKPHNANVKNRKY